MRLHADRRAARAVRIIVACRPLAFSPAAAQGVADRAVVDVGVS